MPVTGMVSPTDPFPPPAQFRQRMLPFFSVVQSLSIAEHVL